MKDRIAAIKEIEAGRRTGVFQSSRRRAESEAEQEVAAIFAREQYPLTLARRQMIAARRQGAALLEIANECVEIRRSFMIECSELCSESEVHRWREDVTRTFDLCILSHRDAMERASSSAGEGTGAAAQHYEQSAGYAKDRIALAAKEFLTMSRASLPANFGMKHPNREATSSVTVNNSNAIISINSTVDHIGSFVGTIQQHGGGDVANALGRLTEALKMSSIATSDKQRLLDSLDAIAALAAAPERPPLGVAQSMLIGFRSMLGIAADVAQVFSVVGPVLAAHFGFTLPN